MDNVDRDPNDDFSFDTTDNTDAQFAGTGGVGDALDNPGTDGNPTVEDLTAGGTGTAVGGDEEAGGPGGAGGGVVDRIGGIGTTGGESSGALGGTVGTPIPPPPDPEHEFEI